MARESFEDAAVAAARFGNHAAGCGRPSQLRHTPLEDACGELRQAFDAAHGGFGGAPKFPQPAGLEFLLRHAVCGGESGARSMVLHTLRNMADGGIHDQLGGGFCRYSVDERWAIPHFEKMLYDNGPLLALYADAYVLTGEASFRRVAQGIAAFALQRLGHLLGEPRYIEAAARTLKLYWPGTLILTLEGERRLAGDAGEAFVARRQRVGLSGCNMFAGHRGLRRIDNCLPIRRNRLMRQEAAHGSHLRASAARLVCQITSSSTDVTAAYPLSNRREM